MPRVKSHFKVHVSVQNHKEADFWTDPLLRGVWVGLGVMAVQRYADRTEDSFLATSTELMAVTGCNSPASALKRMASLGRHSRVTVESAGSRWRVRMPNFAKKQGFISRNGAETGATSSSSSSSSSLKRVGRAKRARAAPKILEIAKTLTRAFLDSRKVPFPDSRDPTPSAYAKWELEMDRLLRLDGRTAEQVKELVVWLFDPSPRASPDAQFWRANVQGVPKLREKWDQLQACKARPKPNATRPNIQQAGDSIRAGFSKHLRP